MTQSTSKQAWFMWGLAAFFYLYELVLRVSPSVMTDGLSNSFNVSASMLGVLVSFYYYSYTMLQLPCGIFLDRIGVKWILSISALLCSVGSILFALTNNLVVAQFGRFLVGCGSACAFISSLQVASTMFSAKYFVILTGATNLLGTVGGLVGGYPVAKAVNLIGWQQTTYVLAYVGFAVAGLIMLVFPNTVRQKVERKSSVTSEIIGLIRNKQIIITAIVTSLMYLPCCTFAELWAVPYFMKRFNVTNEIASMASSAVFLGIALGSILMAIVANKIKSFTKTLKYSAFACGVLFLIMLYAPMELHISLLIVFFIGILTGAQPIGFTCAKYNATSELSGTTLAFTNCVVMLFGCIFQPLIGYLLDFFRSGKVDASGQRLYSISCYTNAILVIPICLFISFLLIFLMKETYKNSDA